MEKIKSMIKGESSSSDSKQMSEQANSGRNDAREASNQQDFMSKATGKQSTPSSTTTSQRNTTSQIVDPETYETQDQRTAPAVQHETITRQHEDRVQQVVDKDEHQDHYHTTVQPLTDRKVEPTSHRQQQAEVQYRDFEHGDAGKTKAALDAQAAQFKNTRTDGGTTQTSSKLDTVGTESVHHHLHETLQPVIHKETVQPSVTHTTIPIKEVHHGTAHIHEPTVAKPMSVDEFSKVRNIGSSEQEGQSRGN